MSFWPMRCVLFGDHAQVIADYLSTDDLLLLTRCSQVARAFYRRALVQYYTGPWPQPKLLEFPLLVRTVDVRPVDEHPVDLTPFRHLQVARVVCRSGVVQLPDSVHGLTLWCEGSFAKTLLPDGLRTLTLPHVGNRKVDFGDLFERIARATKLRSLDVQPRIDPETLHFPAGLERLKLRLNGDIMPLPESLRELTLYSGAVLPRTLPRGLIRLELWGQTIITMDFGPLLRDLQLHHCHLRGGWCKLPPDLQRLILHNCFFDGRLTCEVPASLRELRFSGEMHMANETCIEHLYITVRFEGSELDFSLAATCPRVTHIELEYGRWDDAVAYVHSLPLKELRLLRLQVNNHQREIDVDFARMPCLEHLYFKAPWTTSRSLARCITLKHLHIETGRTSKNMLRSLPKSLVSLKLSYFPDGMPVLRHFARFTKLQQLDIVVVVPPGRCIPPRGTIGLSRLPASLKNLSIALRSDHFRLVVEGGACTDRVCLSASDIKRQSAVCWRALSTTQ